jgi:hypothetical protein
VGVPDTARDSVLPEVWIRSSYAVGMHSRCTLDDNRIFPYMEYSIAVHCPVHFVFNKFWT